MKKVSILILFIFWAWNCSNAQSNRENNQVKNEVRQETSNTLPDTISFALPDSSGIINKKSDFAGKVIVVDVWATWCAPCKKMMPIMKELEKSYKDKDVQFVTVCIGAAIEKTIWKKILMQEKPAGIHLFAGSWKKGFAADYHVREIPRIIIFSKTGKLVNGNAPLPTSVELKQIIDEEIQRNM